MTQSPGETFGALLREWRRRCGLSQLALSLDAGISARHLSFIETARSVPSRATIHRLSDALRIDPPARDRLLIAAGWAPDAESVRRSVRSRGQAASGTPGRRL